ncbi:uncharacterized protein LOC144772229 isoform X2 [Lissotriton helveticus]
MSSEPSTSSMEDKLEGLINKALDRVMGALDDTINTKIESLSKKSWPSARPQEEPTEHTMAERKRPINDNPPKEQKFVFSEEFVGVQKKKLKGSEHRLCLIHYSQKYIK